MIEFIRKRSNDIVPFDSNRIKQAIIKAHESLPVDEQEVQIILDDVLVQLLDMHAPLAEDEHLTVEMIQDVVEKTLMKHGKFEIAKAYILYREEHQQLREQEATEKRRKLETHDYMVTKHS
ncbi:MAG: ATP cone domain-containing protein [bacterium]